MEIVLLGAVANVYEPASVLCPRYTCNPPPRMQPGESAGTVSSRVSYVSPSYRSNQRESVAGWLHQSPMKEMSLTAKQEAFCLAYMETGNASEAYRMAYKAGNMTTESVNVAASQLLAHHKVSIRVEELQNAAKQRNAITVDDLIKELEEARDAALKADSPQSSAAVAATMGKAKLLGMLTDKLYATMTTKSLPASVDDFV